MSHKSIRLLTFGVLRWNLADDLYTCLYFEFSKNGMVTDDNRQKQLVIDDKQLIIEGNKEITHGNTKVTDDAE